MDFFWTNDVENASMFAFYFSSFVFYFSISDFKAGLQFI
jgi:hypothetical protein